MRPGFGEGVVVILGMHRSGTSALAGCLESEGLFLGDVITRAPYNRKGNREPRAIFQMHEELLAANGGSWDCPPGRVVWSSEHRAVRDDFIASFAGKPLWGFKDPRTLLTLEGWREVLPNPRLVGIFRHPLAVARSLRDRSRRQPGSEIMGLEKGVRLWLSYNERLLALHRANEFPLLCFDKERERFLNDVRRVARLVGLEGGAGAEGFYESELRTQTGDDRENALVALEPCERARALHEQLMERAW